MIQGTEQLTEDWLHPPVCSGQPRASLQFCVLRAQPRRLQESMDRKQFLAVWV